MPSVPKKNKLRNLLIQSVLAIAVGGFCTWLVARKMEWSAVAETLTAIPASAILWYVISLAVTHLFRATRWAYLLRPIGVTLPFGKLFSISTVGFMALLALPFRLGEFVRPYFVVREGKARMSAVLGTVAVERIVDGLLISVLFFVTYALSGSAFSPVLRSAAWISLLGFLGATAFLAFALVWTDATIRLTLKLTLVESFAPKLAARIGDKMRSLIRGFQVLRDPKNLVPFLFQSVIYWGVNGLGLWILARQMGLAIPLIGSYAAMSFTGVLISLPNAPGLVGQFHYGVTEAMGAYLPASTINQQGAYAILVHLLQSFWYVGTGFLALFFAARGRSLRQVVEESNAVLGQTGELAAILPDSSSSAVDSAPHSTKTGPRASVVSLAENATATSKDLSSGHAANP